jgi:hypothetical protein
MRFGKAMKGRLLMRRPFVRLLECVRQCRSVYDALQLICGIGKIGAELCEQIPLLSGLSFRTEYRAFSRVIAQPFHCAFMSFMAAGAILEAASPER